MAKNRVALIIGDVTGESGLHALRALLPALKAEYGASLVVVNGENAAEGFGMNEDTAKEIFAAGADIITSGNHIWEKREILPYMAAEPRLLRPANYPNAPGAGFCRITKDALDWLVINMQGREFMTALDCPFRCFDNLYAQYGAGAAVLVDFHAESGREKEALGIYTKGRAACVVGTHTHVQTADERMLSEGTAYITDIGMTGAQDGIIGMDRETCLRRIQTQVLYKLTCASGAAVVQGIAVTIDVQSHRAQEITRFSRLFNP